MAEVVEGKKRSKLPGIVAGSTIGTLLEWYQVYIYIGLSIYISRVFFPFATTVEAIALVLLTFAIGFVTRPLGALFFGKYGDTIGRKRTFFYTLLIAGIATGLIGLLPGYDAIGSWAIVLLVVFRMTLDFALGGEWGGGMAMILENMPKRRGLGGFFIQSMAAAGLLLSSGVILVLVLIIGTPGMYAYGWRIGFFLAFIILAVGLYMRVRMKESPVFVELEKRKEVLKKPLTTAFKQEWKKIIFLLFIQGAAGSFYYAAVGLPSLFEGLGIISVALGSIGAILFATTDLISNFYGGIISDRIGRKKVIVSGMVISIIILFPSMIFHSSLSFMVVLAIWGLLQGYLFDPIGAFMQESVPANVRYTATSFSFQGANGWVGGFTPYVAVIFGSIAPILYPVYTVIFLAIALGIFAKADLPETKDIGDLSFAIKGS